MTNKSLTIGLLVAVVIAIGGYAFPRTSALFGANNCDSYTCFTYLEVLNDLKVDATATFAGLQTLTGGLKVGSSGTQLDRINAGFCNVNASATTISASSSVTVDCGGGTNGATALTGVTAGDMCLLGQATTTSTVFGGIRVSGASASSTQGFVTAVITNLTGATFTWTATASSSLPYYCVDNA